MSRRPALLLLLLLLPTLLASKSPATSPELIDFDWRGDDVVLVLSDSTGYEIDLAASDTAQLLLRLPGLAIGERLRQQAAGAEAPAGGVAISLGGRGGRGATLTQSGDGASLRIHDDERLGYSIEWRPYTRQLVVHTFDWDRLSYGESQFHQGLIALEQNVPDQAEELLQVAGASGEERAHAVLASLYARRGADSLARYFLRSPRTAEELAALAAVQERSGDSADAAESRARSERALAEGVDRRGRQGRDGRRGAGPFAGGEADRDNDAGYYGDDDDGGLADGDVVLLAVIGGLALLLIIGLIVLSTRRPRRGDTTPTPPPTPPPAPRRSEPAGFRVVERAETVPAAPPTAPAPPVHGAHPAEDVRRHVASDDAGGAGIVTTQGSSVEGGIHAGAVRPDDARTTAAGAASAAATDARTTAAVAAATDARTANTSATSAGATDARVTDAGATDARAAGLGPSAVHAAGAAAAHTSETPAAEIRAAERPDSEYPAPTPHYAEERHVPWSSATESHGATQAEELRSRLRSAEIEAAEGESTLETARRLQVSRDNVELRRLMSAASRERALRDRPARG